MVMHTDDANAMGGGSILAGTYFLFCSLTGERGFLWSPGRCENLSVTIRLTFYIFSVS